MNIKKNKKLFAYALNLISLREKVMNLHMQKEYINVLK